MNSKKINDLGLKSRLSLAPMAGITDYVLRNMVRKFSDNCLLTTEMISSEALVQNSKTEITKRESNHSKIAYQLSGHKPELMAKAAKMLESQADIIDINMGCPVNKVVKGTDGCALMRNPEIAASLVKAIKENVMLPVSVKFRLGYTFDELNFVEFGEKMQAAGASMITIHGRTRSQMYSGEADWKLIKNLVKNVDIPVFANGDITSIDKAVQCLEESQAYGLAVGRGILGDPTLIGRIETYLEKGIITPTPSLEERMQLLKEHLDEEIKLRGEEIGIKFCRKFYPYYISSIPNAAKYRGEIIQELDYQKIMHKLDKICLEAMHNNA